MSSLVWLGHGMLLILFYFPLIHWLSSFISPWIQASPDIWKSEVSVQAGIVKSPVIPSKVFHSCVLECQTACDLDSEVRELESGFKSERGIFSPERLLQWHFGSWDGPGCKVWWLPFAHKYSPEGRDSYSPLNPAVKLLAGSEPHCFVVNFKEEFKW